MKPSWKTAVLVTLLLAVSVGGLAAISTVGGNAKLVQAAGTSPAGPVATVTYPFALPSGYSDPSGMVADSAGNVWVYAYDASGPALFYWNNTSSSLATYPVPASFGSNESAVDPMVIDNAGEVWIGDSAQLYRFDISSTSWTSVPLPDAGLVSPTVERTPMIPGTTPQQFEQVVALSVNTTGQVVVGRMFASALQEVDPATGGVQSIPLPAGTALLGGDSSDVVAGGGGSLSARLYQSGSAHQAGRSRLMVRSAHGTWSAINSCVSSYVNSSYGNWAVGPNCIERAYPTASTVSSVAVTNVRGRFAPTGVVAAPQRGLLVSPCKSGLAVLSLSSGRVSDVRLGTEQVAPSGMPTGQRGPRTEPVVPELMATGGNGLLWFSSANAGHRIGLVSLTR
jgi:hypothetical protein